MDSPLFFKIFFPLVKIQVPIDIQIFESKCLGLYITTCPFIINAMYKNLYGDVIKTLNHND